jgi:TRAP-type C4-dicarboxylate transport system substrate-binding protein
MCMRSKIWDAMSPAQQAKFQAAADKMSAENIKRFDEQETSTLEYFKKEGRKVYEPDVQAFRAYAQKKYVDKYGKDWPKGALEKINAIS